MFTPFTGRDEGGFGLGLGAEPDGGWSRVWGGFCSAPVASTEGLPLAGRAEPFGT